MAEKKQELEKRLQDVTGQLGNAKKTAKKGKNKNIPFFLIIYVFNFLFKNLLYVIGWNKHCYVF